MVVFLSVAVMPPMSAYPIFAPVCFDNDKLGSAVRVYLATRCHDFILATFALLAKIGEESSDKESLVCPAWASQGGLKWVYLHHVP
jgi:hypothetical protein